MNGADVRDLLSMKSTAAYAVAGFFVLACLTCASSTLTGVSAVWPEYVAVVVLSAAVILLLRAPGDPPSVRSTAFMTASGPIAAALVFAVVPVPLAGSLQTWPLGMPLVIYTFMCVRGRTLAAWLGLALTMSVAIGWAVLTGQGILYGLSFSAINVAPLLMATFFAFTIRPLAAAIFELRKQSTVRIASQAAAAAVLEERDARLASLDALARPLLQRIADGPDLTDEELLGCVLLEAELRDSLRARGLVRPNLARAARSARARGVEVMMLDDRAPATLDDDARDRIVAAASNSLDGAHAGSVTVRLLPAGRAAAATVLLDDLGDGALRIEYDDTGRIRG
ncbi:hypothetical protein ASG84_23615 [Rhodococcus sp. Leaf278]|uniref:hypothetical protein n=1 Tax=Rhodococcus sp. Leaf278 TaxID=1736319 RepID=UPI00070FB883|nr:hypothetical protein [Rhodococcus sp. Leaf278]KQU54025.1 hypothetical protein ASG84_23615 [Rhodococcus sp. Leaf278]